MNMKYPHIMQLEEKDCGAACLSMICEFYGAKFPITKCRDLIKADTLGATIYGIVRGSETIGLEATALEGNEQELLRGIQDNEIHFPFIAKIVNQDLFEHFIVVYAIKNNKMYIGDPAQSKIIKIPFKAFLERWQGEIIVFKPGKDWKKQNIRKGALNKFFNVITKQKKILGAIFFISLFISGINLFSATVFEHVIDSIIVIGDHSDDFHSDTEQSTELIEETTDSATPTFFSWIKNGLDILSKNLESICILIIGLYLFQSALTFIRSCMLTILAKNIELPISTGYFNHLVDLPVDFFGSRKGGELMSRFSDASSIREAMSTVTLTIMLDTIMAIVTGIYLFFLSSTLFGITGIILVLYFLITVSFKKPIKMANQSIMRENAQVTAYLKEMIDGIETIKAHQYEQTSKSNFTGLFTSFINRVVHGSITYNLLEVLISTVESVGIILLLWVGAHLCIANTITLGTLITFYYLLSYFFDPVKSLIDLQPTIQRAIVAAERLNDIFDATPEETSPQSSDNSIPNLAGDIHVEHVNFRYGNRRLILQDISLKISQGSKIAIVGESGCGKTTLAKLLLRFYAPENGVITINQKNLSDYPLAFIRHHISYVSQNIFLFSDTIYNNLRMGNMSLSDNEIQEVCKKCLADDFIKGLPFGYNTMLEENGNNLSAGQKQRLGIARALLQKPDLLILDEATSNLDSITEKSIQVMLNDLSSEMTVIIIAHRLRTIQNCDYIYVMDDGQIKEEGCHESLMSKNGIYAGYWKSQL